MTDAIGPGSAVVCVDASGRGSSRFPLKVGGVYIVDNVVKVHKCNHDGCNAGLRLLNTGRWKQFCPGRFKPYNGPEEPRRAASTSTPKDTVPA